MTTAAMVAGGITAGVFIGCAVLYVAVSLADGRWEVAWTTANANK